MHGALVILCPAALQTAGCASARMAPATGKKVNTKVLNVSYAPDSSNLCVESIGEHQKLKRDDGDTLLLRFDNQCNATMDVAIEPGKKGPTVSCDQPPVDGKWKVSIEPKKKKYLDCSIGYTEEEHKMQLHPPDPVRASELVLDEVP